MLTGGCLPATMMLEALVPGEPVCLLGACYSPLPLGVLYWHQVLPLINQQGLFGKAVLAVSCQRLGLPARAL